MKSVRKADISDLNAIVSLAKALWPEQTTKDLNDELSALLDKSDACIMIAFKEKTPIGFAHCQLRYEYVEGTHSSPVGYLEGIYIKPSERNNGYARQLLSECESWAKQKGCTEFASDCECNNVASIRFHLATGFKEANRIVCFTKQLK